VIYKTAALSVALMIPVVWGLKAETPTFTTLYAFNGYVNSGDGIQPATPLVMGVGGVVYGTTSAGGISNNGTIFALSPPWSAGDVWRETQLHLFTGGSDGSEPTALLLGDDGVLYGVTGQGGSGCSTGCGTAFSLTPPRGLVSSTAPGAGGWEGSWTKETYAFSQEIVLPNSLRWAWGAMYGTSILGGTTPCDAFLGCGTVFALEPPTQWNQSWQARVLFSFPDGVGGYRPIMAALGRDGVFYGTTQGGNPNCPFGCGLAFSLTPFPQGNASAFSLDESVLHTFIDQGNDGDGVAGLVIGDDGVLYGVTSGGGVYGYGTFFSLTPPAGPGSTWTERILYNFNGPDGAAVPNPQLVVGRGGVIFGTAYGILGGGDNYEGAVWSMTPNGDGTWTEKDLHIFSAGDDGGNPVAGLVIGGDGTLFGTTTNGGGNGKFGTVFALRP
jgi:uncharacterized repeat protein (TIGR03803 family)